MWTVKLIAAGMILLCGVMIGLEKGDRLAQKRKALQDVLLLLRLVKVRMENGQGLWLNELGRVAADADFQVLEFPLKVPEGISLEKSLQSYLSLADPEKKLTPVQTERVIGALKSAVTKEETAARLDYFYHLLEEELVVAAEKEKQDRKLYTRLGWMGGALLAILLW